MNTQACYESQYVELIREFAEEAREADLAGITALHLPITGVRYGQARLKIVLVGEETRGWGQMKEFLADANVDPRSPGRRWEGAIHDFTFTKWTNNFCRTFWDTVFRLIAIFNAVSDWKALKQRKLPELLSGFVWANSNSLEGYGVTARKNGAQYSEWAKLKEASRRFDRLQLILNSFTPNVVVVMNWDAVSHYFPVGLDWQVLGDHLEYAFHSASRAHIFRTAHPTWLSIKRLYKPTLTLIADKWEVLSDCDSSIGHIVGR